jgi:hypothetical protein
MLGLGSVEKERDNATGKVKSSTRRKALDYRGRHVRHEVQLAELSQPFAGRYQCQREDSTRDENSRETD